MLSLLAGFFVYHGLDGQTLFTRLHNSQPNDPGSDSDRTLKLLEAAQAKKYPITTQVELVNLPQQADEVAKLLPAFHQDLKAAGASTITDPFIIFDPQLPEGKKRQAQIDVARQTAIHLAQEHARRSAQQAGASPTQLHQAQVKASQLAQAEVERQLPSAWKTIKNSQLNTLISPDNQGFLLISEVPAHGYNQPDPNIRQAVEDTIKLLPQYFTGTSIEVKVKVIDFHILQDGLNKQVKADMVKGEALSAPVALLIMAIVFGGLICALIPLFGAGLAIMVSLLVLLVVSYFLTLESFVVNVVSFLGLGLAIDYGLLIVSRYREELKNAPISLNKVADDQLNRFLFWPRPLQFLFSISGIHGRTDRWLPYREYRQRILQARRPYLSAVIKTMNTAGTTVFFSGLVVALTIFGLVLFPQNILRSMGIGAVIVVLLSLLVNWTLVPSLLILFGPILSGKKPKTKKSGPNFSFRLATLVAARPWTVVVVSLLLLGFLASPLLSLQVRSFGLETLPKKVTAIRDLNQMWQRYPKTATTAIAVYAQTDPQTLTNWAEKNLRLKKVKGFSPAEELIFDKSAAKQAGLPDPGGKRYAKLNVLLTIKHNYDPQVSQLVAKMKQIKADFPVWYGGNVPTQEDFQAGLLRDAPLILVVILLVTIFLIFIMTGSIILPLQAVILNLASLFASLGVTVWVFQNGHLQSWLHFESLGAIEAYAIAIFLCFGFGLSMDYEMFLLSRVKEIWDKTGDNRRAVVEGLSHSARIITSAALILLVVFAGFTAGDILQIKLLGFALATAVTLDATVVRMGLVPALMIILGKANWWAPKKIQGFLARYQPAA